MPEAQIFNDMETQRFKDLKQKFSHESSLPELPGASMKLIQALEGSEVNVSEVERIITGDPALTAAVLRAASSALYGGMDSVTTVRGAIIRLGQQSVQAVAVSLGVQALMGKTGASSLFDRTRFARHSIFVGFLARYLFACRFNKEAFKCKWSKDEIFAAGILHELGFGLLARVEPEAYEAVFEKAKKNQESLHTAFKKTYGASMHSLSAIASRTWGLPPLFTETLEWIEDPMGHPEESIALACLSFADNLAEENHFGMTRWDAPEACPKGVQAEVGLPPDDLPGVIMLVSRHTGAYVPLTKAA